jgi:hypothetical protein
MLMNFTRDRMRVVLCATALWLLGSWASAQSTEKAKGPPDKGSSDKGPKMTKEEREFAERVNKAIDRGVKYLQGLQNQADGSFPRMAQNQKVGATALAGLAMLEGGVDPNDKAIPKAAEFVRKGCIAETYNYSVSLAIMFLDRLGDPQDVPFIQALGVRLLTAQDLVAGPAAFGQPGGWSYFTPGPTAAEQQRLTKLLQNRRNLKLPAKDGKPKKKLTMKDLPADLQARIPLTVAKAMPKGLGGQVDNSNTQFALIALWVARRHGIPVQTAFHYADQRLRRTQAANGGWSHAVPIRGLAATADTTPDLQMSCCGLIGLGLAYGAADPAKGAKKSPQTDKYIERALILAAGAVGVPKSDLAKVSTIPPGDGQYGKLYYQLWTLERMAVLYDFKDFGVVKDKEGKLHRRDWYKWGAQILVRNQQADGSWKGSYSEGGCDTCFALPFLKRTNLTHDVRLFPKHRKKIIPPLKEDSSAAPRYGPAPILGSAPQLDQGGAAVLLLPSPACWEVRKG